MKYRAKYMIYVKFLCKNYIISILMIILADFNTLYDNLLVITKLIFRLGSTT